MKRMKSIILLFILFTPVMWLGKVFCLENPDYVVTINAGAYKAYYFHLDVNDSIYIEFEVTSGGNKEIDAYLFRSSEFSKFAQSQSFSYIYYLNRYTLGSIFYNSSFNDTYYFVLDNSVTIWYDKTIEIKYLILEYTPPSPPNPPFLHQMTPDP
ncbi:MAG: emp24/gp25L/p24 family protein, partial [Promethearchaeota archaeon]